MDHTIPTKRPNLALINKIKRICHLLDLAVPVDHRVKMKESKKIVKYLDLARELKKAVEYKGDGNTYCNWCTWNGP